MRKFFKSIILITPILIFKPNVLNAETYTNDLSKCMIEETTLSEKVDLVKWAVRLFGEHPSVDIVNLDQSSTINLDKKIGTLVSSLLLDRCKLAARKALDYEGERSIITSFGIVARASSNKIMSHPDVQAASQEWGKYLDLGDLLN